MTEIQIQGRQFLIDGAPTYQGVTHHGEPVEGLLLNSRMVQAIFDDENPATAHHWRYPDTGVWDPDRNTDEFCAALPEYRRHGLLAVTVGLQGGGSIYQPKVFDHYVNSAFDRHGALKPAYVPAVCAACSMRPTRRAWSSSSTISTGARSTSWKATPQSGARSRRPPIGCCAPATATSWSTW